MTKPPVDTLIRFRSNGHEATVTQHTERGFKYLLARTYPFIPRWGMSFSGEGEVFTDIPEHEWFLRDEIEVISAFSEEPVAPKPLQFTTYP